MVLENPLLPYLTWLIGYPWTDAQAFLNSALFRFVLTAAVLSVIALVVRIMIALVRHGPMKAGDITYRVVVNGFRELLRTSPRRVWAIARLCVKESIRRRVIIAPAIYIVILLFSSWYVPTGVQQPGKLFFSYVLGWTTLLILLIALLVSAFSLPSDFKTKTIYTIVTKPVRAGDIVLGRILGFTIVGTVLLEIMALCSAGFVWRMLEHEHEITSTERGGEVEYHVGGPRGLLRARVPEYGKVRFTDRKGVEVAKGISVGSEWTYRSFVEGGTPMSAIWTFSGINE